MAPSKDMDDFRKLLRSSKNIIAVAGAGLSAASGTLTNSHEWEHASRAGGMWRKYDAISLATPEGFQDSPSLSWQFYHYRREAALRAHPNNAHRALSAFSLPSIRHQISPSANFTLITQNVDGLSARADKELAELYPGDHEQRQLEEQPHLIEMHGRLFDLLCVKCGHVEFNATSPICDALSGTEALVEQGTIDPIIDIKDLPHCSKCEGLARPGVVWFGEIPHHLDAIDVLVEAADLCIVVGTSSTVYPAASYAHEVQNHGGKVAVFNLERSVGDRMADYLFLGPCEETLLQTLSLDIVENGKVTVKDPVSLA